MSYQAIESIMQAVQSAALLCRRVQDDFLTRLNKKGDEPVTIADYAAQAIISRAIHRAFPHEAIIAEESAGGFRRNLNPQQQATIAGIVAEILGEAVSPDDIAAWLDYGQDVVSESTWIIDPIDGTRGFLAKDHYVIGVGLVEGGRAMGAILGCPEFRAGELLLAWDGVAYSKSLFGDDAPVPFTVSKRGIGESIYPVDEISKSRADGGIIERLHKTFRVEAPVIGRVYAQLMIYVHIARGDSDIFICKPMSRCSAKVWDHAAGVALVEAAGGIVTDFEGEPIDFSRGDTIPNASLAVSNGWIHPYILDSIRVRPRFI